MAIPSISGFAGPASAAPSLFPSAFFRADFGSALSVRRLPQARVAPAPSGTGASLRDLASTLIDLRRAVDDLRAAAQVRQRGRTAASAAVASNSALGLTLQSTPTTLASTGEFKALATSFTPTNPSFNGASTTSPTIGGVYDGSQGTDTLTFKAKGNGVVGVDDIDIEVRDGQGNKLETIRFDSLDPPGTVKTLANGLTLSLSAGAVVKKDTFEVDVTATEVAVDPDRAFNDPAGLLDISTGSFTINGATIAVAETDTLNAVLDRITNSAAGVTATFDSATGQVTLTQKTPGSAPQIVLGADDSGFFDATNLSGATPVSGTDDERALPIDQVAAFSVVKSGSFSVNGVQLQVDPSVDSLDDVLARINASGAGVIATFDATANVVRITSQQPGRNIVLDNGSSKLFTGLDITTGTHVAPATGLQQARRFHASDALPALFVELGRGLQALFGTEFADDARGLASRAHGELQAAVEGAFRQVLGQAGGSRLSSGLGLDFEFADGRDVLSLDARALRDATARRFDQAQRFLLADRSGGSGGLLVALDDVLTQLGRAVAEQLDPVASRGLRLDLTA